MEDEIIKERRVNPPDRRKLKRIQPNYEQPSSKTFNQSSTSKDLKFDNRDGIKTWTANSYFSVVVTIFVVLVTCALPPCCSGMCPPRCTCDEDALSANCESAQLEFVPIVMNPKLKSIKLRGNKISTILEGLKFYSDLTTLDVSLNNLSSLGFQNFKEQHNLHDLNASNNHIGRVDPGAFEGLHTLRILDLSSNDLETIENDAFLELSLLRTLDLSNNKISFIDSYAFSSLLSLQYLYLNNNSFYDIPTLPLRSVVSLKVLNLASNSISNLGSNAFPQLEELRALSLDNNSIDIISSSAFEGVYYLQDLSMTDNNLTKIPTNAISKLEKLVELDLSGNWFEVVDSIAFKSLYYLTNLTISRVTSLSFLHPRALIDTIRLEELVMDDNPSLKALPDSLFEGNPLISKISLQSNKIITVSESHFPLDQLRMLNLSGNPFTCNCSLLWLWKLYRKTNSSLQLDDITCAGPLPLQGMLLSKLPSDKIECDTPWKSIFYVAIVIIGLFAVTCGFLLFMGSGAEICKKADPLDPLQNGDMKGAKDAHIHGVTPVVTWDMNREHYDTSFENEYVDVGVIPTKSGTIVYV